MRVISKRRLRQFWEQNGHGDSEGPLKAWHTHVDAKVVTWQGWADIKQSFATASIVGNCVVFDIGGNKYRLIVRVLYTSQKVFVLKVMTHSEYDDTDWKSECGCHERPPKRSPKPSRVIESKRSQAPKRKRS